MLIYNILYRYQKSLMIILFCVVFSFALIQNIPTFILAAAIKHYSMQKLKLYDTKGTFWRGSGLLVAVNAKTLRAEPLIMLNWDINLGIKKIIDAKFLVENQLLANIYLDRHALHIDNLDMSLSIAQVSELMGLIKNLGLSGNLNIKANNIILNNGKNGIFVIKLNDLSSSMSPVNPLGNYTINFNLANNDIDVVSDGLAVLNLTGHGSLNTLTLTAKILENKKEDMLQFITVLGAPQANGTYNLKLF